MVIELTNKCLGWSRRGDDLSYLVVSRLEVSYIGLLTLVRGLGCRKDDLVLVVVEAFDILHEHRRELLAGNIDAM